jgi:hypothetical protein
MRTDEQPGRRAALVMALIAWATGCGSAPEPPAAGAAARGSYAALAGAAETCPVERVPLVLPDGTHVYIEPQSLFRVRSEIVVAGSPSYTWETRSDTTAVMLTHDALAAAYLDPIAARTIPIPVQGATLGTVRAVALDGARWGAVFSSVDPDSVPQAEIVRGLWYAEYDGSEWSAPERLPMPSAGELLVDASSQLVAAGDRIAWALPQYFGADPTRVLYYERVSGTWSLETVPSAYVDNAALAYDDDLGVLLALFGEDVDLPGWQQSLRLYRRGSSWELVSRVAVAPAGVRFLSPGIASDSDGVSVGWSTLGPDGFRAYARVGIRRADPGTEVLLDDAAVQLVTVRGHDARSWFVVDHVDSVTSARELRLVGVDPSGRPHRLISVANPYTGYFAALATSATEALVVGPEFSPDPARPTVRSLLLRLSTSCA